MSVICWCVTLKKKIVESTFQVAVYGVCHCSLSLKFILLVRIWSIVGHCVKLMSCCSEILFEGSLLWKCSYAAMFGLSCA